MKHSTYIKLEKEVFSSPDDNEYGNDRICECYAIPLLRDEEEDFWGYEYGMSGMPEAWYDSFKDLAPGYYKMEFETFTETDYEEGYASHSYECLEEEIPPTLTSAPIRGRFLVFDRWRREFQFTVLSLFGNCWEVDVDDSGIGFTRQKMWFPEALWYRYFGDYSIWFGDCPRNLLNVHLKRGHWVWYWNIRDRFDKRKSATMELNDLLLSRVKKQTRWQKFKKLFEMAR